MNPATIYEHVSSWLADASDMNKPSHVREDSLDEISGLFRAVYSDLVKLATNKDETNEQITLSLGEMFGLTWSDSGTCDAILLDKMHSKIREVVLDILKRKRPDLLQKLGMK